MFNYGVSLLKKERKQKSKTTLNKLSMNRLYSNGKIAKFDGHNRNV